MHRALPAVAALEALARGARADLPPSDVEEALARCGIRDVGPSWAADLERAGAVLALRTRAFELAPNEIVSPAAGELLPLVHLSAGPDPRCIVVIAVSVGRALVVVTDHTGETHRRKVDASELTSLLAIPADARSLWLRAEPTSHSAHQSHDHHHPSPTRRLLSIAKLERDDVGVVLVYAVAVGLLSLATPLGVQVLVNTVAFGALLQPLVVLTLLVLATLSLDGFMRALQYWVVERIQRRLFVRVALDVAYRLPNVRASVFDKQSGPEMVNRFFDVTGLQKGAATLLSDGVSIVLHSLMGMLILAFYHPFLLVFDLLMLGGIAGIIFGLGRGATPTAIAESKAKYAVAAWLEDAARHRASLAHGDGPAFVAARAESLTRAWLDGRRRHWRVVFRQISSALALQAIASAALLGIGGALVLERQLTLGQLVAAELIVSTVVASFAKLGKSFESYYDLVAATDKIGHLTDLEQVKIDGTELPARETGLDVSLKRVSLPRGEGVVARNVELHLRPGSRTVVYAKTGAGKSSLADVIIGARRAASGRVLFDGVPFEDLSEASLSSIVTLVRHPEIFEGTLFDNIAMGRRDVGRVEVREALKLVGMSDIVDQLPRDLDTPLASETGVLGDAGALLVTLARAVRSRTRILVIDGALDRLDDVTRQKVWSAITSRPWTVLVTTSRSDMTDLGDTALTLEGDGIRVARSQLRLAASEEA